MTEHRTSLILMKGKTSEHNTFIRRFTIFTGSLSLTVTTPARRREDAPLLSSFSPACCLIQFMGVNCDAIFHPRTNRFRSVAYQVGSNTSNAAEIIIRQTRLVTLFSPLFFLHMDLFSTVACE